MKRQTIIPLICVFFILAQNTSVWAADPGPGAKERCPVCGMFVAKYPHWLASLTQDTGAVFYFDGVKDMMAYYFAPGDFGGDAKIADAEVRVTDYYSMKLIDGKTALYVLGSDVLGPMGHELIPFGSEAAAQNFLKDHRGTEILPFSAISPERIDSMRKGHRMKK